MEVRREGVLVNALAPTPEQSSRFQYESEKVVERGQTTKAVVHKRVPLVKILVGNKAIGEEEGKALLWYRDRWDATQYSIIGDSLGRHMPQSGGGDYDKWRIRIMDAEADVRFAESGVPAWLLATLRLVALHDHSFADVSRDRWPIEGAVPGKYIMRVTREFAAASSLLLMQVRHITS